MATATISIVAWDEFQHYRDRDPPWIKLYRDILTSTPWLLGSDISRLVQIALILLAARYKNSIPYTPIILKAAHLDCTKEQLEKAIKFLQSVEFITIQGLNGHALADCYTEKERSEQGRARESRAELHLDLEQVEDGDSVSLIFDYWKSVWKHPRSQLDPKRRSVIKRALKTYDAKTLCEAIVGYKNSAYHTGANDRHTTYDDIELFLRDAAHIDAGLKYAEGDTKRRAPTTAELEARENAKH